MKIFYLILILLLPLIHIKAETESSDSINLKANKVILKYTGSSLEPSSLTLDKLDSSVFFLNFSSDKDVNLEVNFKGKKMHCHSDNMKLENGVLHSVNPIKARDFEILCFPTPGIYKYIVKETGKNSKELRGEILINE